MKTTPALLLIDVQKAFDDPYWGIRNNPQAENNIALMLQTWRQNEYPVIHVRHCSVEPNSPLRPEAPGNAFKDEALPIAGEKVISKTVNSAFIGTDLQEYLRDNGLNSLVIAGLTTDHCVSTTTRMAGNLGFDVTLVGDASAAFDRSDHLGNHFSAEQIHQIHLASLNAEFCSVKSTQDVLLEVP